MLPSKHRNQSQKTTQRILWIYIFRKVSIYHQKPFIQYLLLKEIHKETMAFIINRERHLSNYVWPSLLHFSNKIFTEILQNIHLWPFLSFTISHFQSYPPIYIPFVSCVLCLQNLIFSGLALLLIFKSCYHNGNIRFISSFSFLKSVIIPFLMAIATISQRISRIWQQISNYTHLLLKLNIFWMIYFRQVCWLALSDNANKMDSSGCVSTAVLTL